MKLTKGEWDRLFECLKWNKYHFEQKPSDSCDDKEGTLNEMIDLINKLKDIRKFNDGD